MNIGDCITILSTVVGIVAILVAIMAIMFGYNLTVFRKRVDNKIKRLKKESDDNLETYKRELDERLSKYQNDMVAFGLIQQDIALFIDMEIKSGLASIKNGTMSLSVALRKSSELNNPYISASVLNQLTKVLAVTSETDFAKKKSILGFVDTQKSIVEYVEKNIKILEDANMLNLLVDADGNPQYVRECISKLVKVYNKLYCEYLGS